MIISTTSSTRYMNMKKCLGFFCNIVLTLCSTPFFQYANLQNLTLGNHAYGKIDGKYTPLSVCQLLYKNSTIDPERDTFHIDPHIDEGTEIRPAAGSVLYAEHLEPCRITLALFFFLHNNHNTRTEHFAVILYGIPIAT